MKKLSAMLTAAVMCMALAIPASAQSVAVGGEVGLDFANFGGDVEDMDSRTGPSVAGVLRFDFPGTFGLQTGLGLTSRGATASEGGLTLDTELNYLEIPALLTLNVPTAGPVSPRLFAGPTASFELGCTVKLSDADASLEEDCQDTKSTDFGVAFGGGLDFGFGPGQLTLDGRYNLGLSNIEDVADSDFSMKNRALNVRAGFLLPLGG